MSSYGSSVINKSGKKLAPKAPPRRRPAGQALGRSGSILLGRNETSTRAGRRIAESPESAAKPADGLSGSSQPSGTVVNDDDNDGVFSANPSTGDGSAPLRALRSSQNRGHSPDLTEADVIDSIERGSKRRRLNEIPSTAARPGLAANLRSAIASGVSRISNLLPSSLQSPALTKTSDIPQIWSPVGHEGLTQSQQEVSSAAKKPGEQTIAGQKPVASSSGPQIVIYEVPGQAAWSQTTKSKDTPVGKSKDTWIVTTPAELGRLNEVEASTSANQKTKTQDKRTKSNRASASTRNETEEDATGAAEEDSPRLVNAQRRKQKARARTSALRSVSVNDAPDDNQPEKIGEDRNGQPEDQNDQSRKRRKRKRAGTPDGAEAVTIVPSVVTMYELASRDRRTGWKSEREKKMRLIDWKAIKIRRREEEVRTAMNRGKKKSTTAASDSENGDRHNDGNSDNPEGEDGPTIDEKLQRAVKANRAKQQTIKIRLVNGEHVVDEQSQVVDAHAIANEDADALEEIEEDDLTQRFNCHTYGGLRRREPTERIRVRDRWSDAATDKFYQCLAEFGTEFLVISKMFPGRTRRHIKAKFVREERADPDRVRQALNRQHQESGWNLDIFRQEAGLDEADFKDPRKVEEELRLRRLEREKEIEEQRMETLEVMRQRRLAGDVSEDEEAAEDLAHGDDITQVDDVLDTGKSAKRKKNNGPKTGGEEVEIVDDIED